VVAIITTLVVVMAVHVAAIRAVVAIITTLVVVMAIHVVAIVLIHQITIQMLSIA
jgi:hypothetical protein